MGDVHYFGIRHHGPGSARRLLAALAALQPKAVLIEGPSDLSDLMPAFGHPAMTPPVALLAYAENAPERAVFWPFAEYSPEYQAARWALANGAALSFIDLPASARLAPIEEPPEVEEGDAPVEADDAATPEPAPLRHDPIGALARAAGYEDTESWWNDVIEVTDGAADVFAAVDDAMATLREGEVLPADEARREAQMRLAIAKAAKETDGPVAVVCGAWHVPALREKHAQKDDRALLKGLPKAKVKATWVPWSALRLARGTGYGAGVPAPGWYRHLWENGSGDDAQARWVGRIGAALREKGQLVSTASLIEVVRLTRSLAAIRERPSPGFEEMREAAISCLMQGEPLPWHQIEAELLLGSEVGAIPPDLPLAPLLEDLERQQKACRLKPEALERELSLDLRSDSGLARSTLLHRLNALNVPWGKLADAGRSRGTFREKWVIGWEPEYAVELVENLIHGPTIEAAANGRLSERMREAETLGALAEDVHRALIAQLPRAAEAGIARLELLAAQTDDCASLLQALPPLVDILRYGTAREMSLDHLESLARRITVQAALALPYAARGLDADASHALYRQLDDAHRAILLADLAEDDRETWFAALEEVSADRQAARLVAGLTTRLVYEADRMDAEAIATLMNRALSPATPVPEAAAFFEGFFSSAGQRLIHDTGLREAVDAWMLSLDEDIFVESLPLFRRVFSALAKPERQSLLEKVLGRVRAGETTEVSDPEADALWEAHLATLTRILTGGGY